jgi:4-amino-4-deoxy-L-arabinose transferase-like glycosyltransferase
MGLGWDSVLKLAAFGVLIVIILQVIFYFIFQDIGYYSLRLSIALSVFILVIICLNLALRIMRKKFIC